MSIPSGLQTYLIELSDDGGPPHRVDTERNYVVGDADGEPIGTSRVSNEGLHLRVHAIPSLIERMHNAFHVTPVMRGDELDWIKIVDEAPTLD